MQHALFTYPLSSESTIYSIDGMYFRSYNSYIKWDIEYTDEFGNWWETLTDKEQVSVAASVGLLEKCGPNLGFPHSSGIKNSRHNHIRELRTQHEGRPLRTLYAFDPRRKAVLLIGGDKSGNERWYDVYIPIAERLYDEHLTQLKKEGKFDG